MSKLKEKELLEVLKIWYTGEHTQAYKQIWELIQKPAVAEEWIEEKAKQLYTEVGIQYREILDKINILRDTVKALEIKCEEKLTASDEFVEKWVKIIRPETPTSIRMSIKDMLKEAGVKVVKK